MKLPTEKVALLAIDLQNGFCSVGGTFDRSGIDVSAVLPAVRQCITLVRAARQARVPVILTQAWFRADGTDAGIAVTEVMRRASPAELISQHTWDAAIVDAVGQDPEDHVVRKIRFSPFAGSVIDPLLTSLRVESLVVCGLTTSICVESAVRDAASRDYRVFVARDAVAEYNLAMHEASLAVIAYGFGFLTSTQEVVEAWGSMQGR